MNVTANILSSLAVDAVLQNTVVVDADLTGIIPVTADLPGPLAVTAGLTSDVAADADLVTTIRVSSQGYADYTGDYEVTSFTAAPLLTTSLVLPTNDKHMLDDVTVYSVPTSEEYNDAGGVTFTIG